MVMEYAGAKPENITDQLRLLSSLAAAMNDTTTDLTAGRYPSTAEAEAAIQQRVSEAMAKHYKPATTQAH